MLMVLRLWNMEKETAPVCFRLQIRVMATELTHLAGIVYLLYLTNNNKTKSGIVMSDFAYWFMKINRADSRNSPSS
jgi:hypothetical protein